MGRHRHGAEHHPGTRGQPGGFAPEGGSGWWQFPSERCQLTRASGLKGGCRDIPGGAAAVPGVGGDPLQQPDEPRRQRGEEGLGAEAGLEELGQALHGPGVAADHLVLGGHGVGDEGVGAAEVLGGGEGVWGRAGPESAPSPQICRPAPSTQPVLSQPSLRSRVNAPQTQLRSPTLPFPVLALSEPVHPITHLGAHLAPPAQCPPR